MKEKWEKKTLPSISELICEMFSNKLFDEQYVTVTKSGKKNSADNRRLLF